MNPNNEIHRSRLFKAVEYHFRVLRPFRREREQLVRDYAGNRYGGKQRKNQEKLVNLIMQTAEAYTMALAANLPRVLVSTDYRDLRGFAQHFQIAINNLIKEIHLDETLQAVVLDAFFGPGLLKIYLGDAPQVELETDVWMDPGSPFAERLSLDNFVYDTSSDDFRKVQFASDRYRVPIEVLQDKDLYDQSVAKKITPGSKWTYKERDEDLTSEISTGRTSDSDEYGDHAELCDVWLPDEELLVTWVCDARYHIPNMKPLVVRERDDPESGPYKMLNLGKVPDNIMPSSPGQNLKALSDLYNSVYRKLANQARRQKTMTLYEGDAENDTRRMKNGVDGEYLLVNNVAGISTHTMGGVDQGNLAFSIQTLQQFDRMGGNVSAKLGLGPQSDTLGQDAMIQQKVQQQESAMRHKVVRLTKETVSDLGWLLYDDPVKTIPGELQIEGTPYSVNRDWTPTNREGAFLDYNFDIEPYSMAYKDPQERAAILSQTLAEMAPMLPMLQQMGITLDLKAYLRIKAELLDAPRLLEIFDFDAPQPPGPYGEPPKQAAHTVRENIRHNVSTGGTQASKDNVMMQQLFSGNSQANGDQMATQGIPGMGA